MLGPLDSHCWSDYGVDVGRALGLLERCQPRRPVPERPASAQELPLAAEEPRERADAARNRARILAAARGLFAEQGVENTTMDELAAAAGVGKGTLFRRFGDRAGLALALLGEAERELQEAVLRGPPPLGPGAPPAERLRAFLGALLDLSERHRDLLLASESGAPAGRFRTAVYAGWHQHTTLLVAEARPDLDASLMADLLLAPLAAGLVEHLRVEREVQLDALRAALDELVTGVVGR